MDPINSSQEEPKPSSEIASAPAAPKANGARHKRSAAKSAHQKTTAALSVTNSATGPRTPQGKNRSKSNASKHGILSSVVVLPDESRPDYESLLGGFRESLQPVGSLEEILVEKLANLLWRHRRLICAEGAEIRKKREFLEWDAEHEQRREAEKQAREKPKEDSDFFSAADANKEGLIWHIENSEIVDRCLELLSRFREQIEVHGPWSESEDATSILEKIYGSPTQEHISETLYDNYAEWRRLEGQEEPGHGYASPKGLKRQMLRAIDFEIKRLTEYKEKQFKIGITRIEIEKLRQSVPDTPALDHLMRYEASLERSFDRTLSQFERMQRLRKGQIVPPPIKLELSS